LVEVSRIRGSSILAYFIDTGQQHLSIVETVSLTRISAF